MYSNWGVFFEFGNGLEIIGGFHMQDSLNKTHSRIADMAKHKEEHKKGIRVQNTSLVKRNPYEWTLIFWTVLPMVFPTEQKHTLLANIDG
jgi:hypothetical protein